MRVIFHDDFLDVYTHDPAASRGRLEAVVAAIRDHVDFEEALPAGQDDIEAVHTKAHIAAVDRQRLYKISALAAGASIQAAVMGMKEPAFGLVRPPGHHASEDSCWGFCYFNNMAIAIKHLKRHGHIETAYILDFDLHYGDGTVNILGEKNYVAIHNPQSDDREFYLKEVEAHLAKAQVDVIGVSAGFDNHRLDWGGVLTTDDYETMGRMVREHARRMGAGCFGILEGGYNHSVLGQNVLAFLRGLES